MTQLSNPINKSIEKSVVKKVTANGTWEGNYGLLYKYEIEMENGHSGDINSKVLEDDEKFSWKVGEEVNYERIQRGQFINFKKHNPEFTSTSNYSSNNNDERFYSKEEKSQIFNAKDRRISKLAILKCSVELVCNDKIDISEVQTFSENMLDWVYDKQSTKGLAFTDDKAPF